MKRVRAQPGPLKDFGVSTGSGSDRVSIHAKIEVRTTTRSLPLPVLTSLSTTHCPQYLIPVFQNVSRKIFFQNSIRNKRAAK
jgi:hypothetical protein